MCIYFCLITVCDHLLLIVVVNFLSDNKVIRGLGGNEV